MRIPIELYLGLKNHKFISGATLVVSNINKTFFKRTYSCHGIIFTQTLEIDGNPVYWDDLSVVNHLRYLRPLVQGERISYLPSGNALSGWVSSVFPLFRLFFIDIFMFKTSHILAL